MRKFNKGTKEKTNGAQKQNKRKNGAATSLEVITLAYVPQSDNKVSDNNDLQARSVIIRSNNAREKCKAITIRSDNYFPQISSVIQYRKNIT